MRPLLLAFALLMITSPLAHAGATLTGAYGPVGPVKSEACAQSETRAPTPDAGDLPAVPGVPTPELPSTDDVPSAPVANGAAAPGAHNCFFFYGTAASFHVAIADASGALVGFRVNVQTDHETTNAHFGPFCGSATVPGVPSAQVTKVVVVLEPNAACAAAPTAGTINVASS